MIRNSFFATVATAAIIAATPALAAPGGGGGAGGMGGGRAAGANAGLSAHGNAGGRASIDVGARAQARGQGFASDRASAKGSVSNDLSSETMTGSRIRTRDLQSDSSTRISSRSNSKISSSSTKGVSGKNKTSASANLSTQLSLQVTPGATVTDSGGATVGTVTGVRTVGNGMVKSVQVTLNDGSVIVLSGNSLTADGDVLVTNSLTTNVNSQGAAHASINGLIHASPKSALGLAGVTTLTGLTTGLTVNDTGGTSLGTVSSVLLNRSGAVVGINVALEGGGTAFIPATDLSISGGIVTTSNANVSSQLAANTLANTSTSTSTNNQVSTTANLSSQLTGVTTGMDVVDSGGISVGTVTGVRTVGNGMVKSVQVTLSDGSVIFLSPNSLSLNGDVLTTTSTTSNVNSQGAAHASINGLIHANPRSALGNAGVTTLTGLTTGLAVQDTTAANVGTVSSVLLNRSGAVVGINVALDGGGSLFIPATDLSISGGVVTTTFTG